MGYTHSFTVGKTIEKKEFKNFSNDCKKLINHIQQGLDIAINGWDGTGKPKFTSSIVSFNGCANLGESHVTMHFENEVGFAFCKTNRKNYDIAVLGVLFLAKHYYGDALKLRSDGEEADHEDALKLTKELFPDYKILGIRENNNSDSVF